MSQRSATLPQLQRAARIASLALLNVCLALAAEKDAAHIAAHPHPHGFASAAPAPSSLLLVMVGFAALLGWNWWRTRARSAASTDH